VEVVTREGVDVGQERGRRVEERERRASAIGWSVERKRGERLAIEVWVAAVVAVDVATDNATAVVRCANGLQAEIGQVIRAFHHWSCR